MFLTWMGKLNVLEIYSSWNFTITLNISWWKIGLFFNITGTRIDLCVFLNSIQPSVKIKVFYGLLETMFYQATISPVTSSAETVMIVCLFWPLNDFLSWLRDVYVPFKLQLQCWQQDKKVIPFSALFVSPREVTCPVQPNVTYVKVTES